MTVALPLPDFAPTATDFPPCPEAPFSVISAATLHEWITDPMSFPYSSLHIADIRFPYEHAGGCIRGSTRIATMKRLIELYDKTRDKNGGFVFHCEYSHDRSPQMLEAFREYDRRVHRDDWPALSCPNVFLLKGGYKEFYKLYPGDCIGGYVGMRDEAHRRNGDLARCHAQWQREMREVRPSIGRGLLIRSQSQGHSQPFAGFAGKLDWGLPGLVKSFSQGPE